MKQRILKLSLYIMVSLLAVLGGRTQKAMAEGSITINPDDGAYRVYMEYMLNGDTTLNQVRKQIVYVYAYAGEKVYFGSSVDQSRLNANHEFPGANDGTGADIVVKFPDDSVHVYDVNANNGLINTRTKEKNGPSAVKAGGYEAGNCSFTAPVDGLYEFHFHSYDGHANAAYSRDPYACYTNGDLENTAKIEGDTRGQGRGCVAAWDVTVVGKDNQPKTGRMFTYMVAWNVAANTYRTNDVTMTNSLYAASSEGFVYKTDFREMNPWGFIFYGDDKGIMTKDGKSIYSTYYGGPGNEIKDLGNPAYNSNYKVSEDMKSRFMIFFNEPNIDLPDSLLPKVVKAPKPVRNMSFEGSIEGNKSYVGEGGRFKFGIDNNDDGSAKISSVMITIDFSEYDQQHGTNYGVVYLQSSDIKVGDDNYIYWNGKGANGENIPAGVYSDESVSVEATTRGGEYHFILIDVEKNKNGIVVQRMNKKILDQEGNEIALEGANNPYIVHYNANIGDIKIGEGVEEANRNKPNYPDDGKSNYSFIGKNSKGGAVFFDFQGTYDNSKHTNNSNSGDRLAVDIWTYISMPVKMEEAGGKEFEIIELNPDYATGSVEVKLHKVDKEDTSNALEGAKYGVYRDVLCTDLIEEIETDEQGNTSFVIEVGQTVYVKETQAPEGYQLDETVYTYRLQKDPNGEQLLTLTADSGTACYQASREYDKAFDGDYSTFFDGTGYDGYTIAKVAPIYYVTKIGYVPRARGGINYTFGDRLSGAWFAVSDDKTNWTTIKTLGNVGSNLTFEMHEEETTIPAKGTYLKLQSNGKACNVAEVIAYGMPSIQMAGVTGNATGVDYGVLKDGSAATGVTLNAGQYAVADLGGLYSMKGVFLIPVQGQEDKMVGARLEVSVDGENWTFASPLMNRDYTQLENCYFPLPADVRYIRFSVPNTEGKQAAIADFVPLGVKYNLFLDDQLQTMVQGEYQNTLMDMIKTFSLKLVKQSMADGSLLGGAVFGLYKTEADATANAQDKIVLTTDVNGVSQLAATAALKYGETYYIRETQAPQGYILDTTVHSLKVKDDGVYLDGDTTKLAFDTDAITAVLPLKNIPEMDLPITGAWITGQGIIILGVLVCMVCGVAILVRKKYNTIG